MRFTLECLRQICMYDDRRVFEGWDETFLGAALFEDVLTLHRERHVFKVGVDLRRIKVDNLAAFDSKGTFGFSSLQDYMNNLTNFQQALQTASFVAHEWQVFPFVQDDFRVTPELTLNLGLRYEYHTVPLGLFGATDPQSLSAMVPGPVKADRSPPV